MTWRERAACRGMAPDDPAVPHPFFPDEPAHAARAIRVCQRCPVQAECAREALRLRERQGIWGGVFLPSAYTWAHAERLLLRAVEAA